MNFKLEINVLLEAVYDSTNDDINIISCNPFIKKKTILDSSSTIRHKLTKTQIKFGILTLGSRNSIGRDIPLGKEITLIINGDEPIKVTTHKTIRGRIDGLTRVYSRHPELLENIYVNVTFDITNLVLMINTIE